MNQLLPHISKPFQKHNDYMSPKYVWENIKQYIPTDKVIWEAFYGDGQSGKDLTDLGFTVIHKNIDFFENNLGQCIISNPPFQFAKQILQRLKKLDKPFILVMPTSKICTSYFRDFVKDNPYKIQIIIPPRRIHFKKLIDGKVPENWKNQCAFDCFYYCWKMNLPQDIIWLE